MRLCSAAAWFSRKQFTLVLLVLLASCATYYQANLDFNHSFENGKLTDALKSLRDKSSEARGKEQFLYFVNNGLVLSMLGEYEESNEFFEKAYLFGEDYQRNYINEAASYLTNPTFTTYRGEDHEHLMLLYYKALNYLKMHKTEEALIECRRLNIRLQQLSDRYSSDNKYREDAFIHVLMGIIYDADKDYNNAFIAYRNAYNVYRSEYDDLFKLGPPHQLKQDLLRTAWLSGLSSELEFYKEAFNEPDYQYVPNDNGELVFFWHNGLSPIKSEWGVNFIVTRRGDMLFFTNAELGLTFPFSIANYEEKDKKGLARLEVFRVAFPKYVERPTFYDEAELQLGDTTIALEEAEDVNKIAFKCLQERMTLEFSKALIRAALKKVSEYEVRKQDKTLGTVLGVVFAITEKADTRNWQTLPHSIYYCRVPLKPGKNQVTLKTATHSGTAGTYEFTYEARPGEMLFHTFSSLESGYPNYSQY